MGKLRDDATAEYTTALRALRTDQDRADFIRHRARALAEDIDKRRGTQDAAAILTPEQYKELQWLLALLDAWDQLAAELRCRAGFTRTVFDSDDAEQERVGWLTEC